MAEKIPPNGMSIKDLHRLAVHDPTVRSYFMMWQMGDFQSFEAMLIAMCCQLAANALLAKKQLFEFYQREISVAVPPTGAAPSA